MFDHRDEPLHLVERLGEGFLVTETLAHLDVRGLGVDQRAFIESASACASSRSPIGSHASM